MKSFDDKKTVLVADDSKIIRLLLNTTLNEEYRVVEAQDGEEALKILRRDEDIELVILDIMMPVLDGFSVLEEMNNDEHLKMIPVIIVTGNEEDDTLVHALNYGAIDVIAKPFKPEVIKHRVKNIVELMKAHKYAEKSKFYQERLQLMETDKSTGLFNKSAFCRHVADRLVNEPNKKYVILRWNIDHFKYFNDFYGMAEGNKMLKYVGDYYKKIMGDRTDIIYGHWDADHFVTFREKGSFNVDKIVETIETQLAEEYPLFDFVARVGIYEIDDPKMEVALMCDRAMFALKTIKGSFTKHYVYFDENMKNALAEEQEIVNEMKSALAQKQFKVYFQPQYDYAEGTLYGAEALVRWKHPVKGLIPPIKFIPIFESNGFITLLDNYVWEETCRVIRHCMDNDIELNHLSVNVSRHDIFGLDLPKVFSSLVEKYDIPISKLHIEITESAYVENSEMIINMTKKLQECGFHVEMDDFGSGYSSLNTLKDVPVDLIKLDMGFLTGGNNSRGGSIVSSVVRMAQLLEIPILAEGVEEKNEAEFLKSIGCLYMQGYYFAKPMPEDEFIALAENSVASVETSKLDTGVDNATDFLDATTQSTLLFNSFVGGAGIFELRGDKVEALRLNDNYFTTLNTTRSQYKEAIVDVLSRFDEKNAALFKAALVNSMNSGTEGNCVVETKPGLFNGGTIWLRIRARFLGEKGSHAIFYIAIDNITEQMKLMEFNSQLTERLTNIMVNLPVGIAIFRMEEKVYAEYITQAVCDIFGYTFDDYQKRMAQGLPIEFQPDTDFWYAASNAYTNSEGVLGIPKMQAYKNDGTPFWLKVEARLIKKDNQPTLCYAILMDITEQVEKDAAYERTLKNEKQRAEVLVSNTPGGIIRYDIVDGAPVVSYVSEGVARLLGYERDELLEHRQEDPYEIIHSEDREGLKYAFNKASLAEKEFWREYRILTKSGKFIWVSLTANPIVNEDGKLSYYGSYTDITEIKKTEMNLIGEMSRVNALFQTGASGMMKVDIVNGENIVITNISENFCQMTGYSYDDIVSRFRDDFYAIILDEDKEKVQKAIIGASQRQESYTLQMRVLCKNGSIMWVEAQGNFFEKTIDENGDEIVSYYATNIDITEQKKIAEQLEEENNRLNTIVNAIPGGIASYEIVDGKQKLLYCTEGVSKLSGRSYDEYGYMLDESLDFGIYKDDVPEFLDQLYGAINYNEELDYTYRIIHKDGSLVWVNARGHRSGEHNGNPTLFMVYYDISTATKMYRDIVNETDTVIQVVDVQSKEILYINEAGLEVADSNERVYYGRPCYEFMSGVDKECENCNIARVLEGHDVVDYITLKDRIFNRKAKHINWNGKDAIIEYLTDVSDSFRIEQMLTEEKEQLNRTINNIPAGIAVYVYSKGEGFRITAGNEAILEVIGVSKNNIEAMTIDMIIERIHPDDRDGVNEKMQMLLENPNRGLNCNYRFLPMGAKDYIWINLNARAIVENENEITIFACFTNITIQTQLQQSVEKEKYIVDLVIQKTNTLIWSYDCATKTIEMQGPEYSRYYEKKIMHNVPESMIEDGIVHSESIDAVRKLHERIGDGEEVLNADISFVLHDGTQYDTVVTYWPISSDGVVTGAIGTMKDVSAERKAILKNAQLDAALHSSAIYFWSVDLVTGEFININHGVENLNLKIELGSNLDYVMESSGLTEEGKKVIKQIQRELHHGQNSINKVVHLKKEITGIEWFRISHTLFEDQYGNKIVAVGVGEDITTLHNMQKLYMEEVQHHKELRSDDLIGKSCVNLTKGTVETYWMADSIKSEQISKRKTSIIEQIIHGAAHKHDKDKLEELFNNDSLISYYYQGIDSVNYDYERRLKEDSIWVRLRLKTFMDHETGDLKVFVYTYDIEQEIMMKTINSIILKKSYEMAGVIDLRAGTMQMVHMENDTLHSYGTVYEYGKALELNINAFDRSIDKDRMRYDFSIDNLVNKLAHEENYELSYMVIVNGEKFYKKWEFSYLDHRMSKIVMLSTDVSQSLEKEAKHREELERALELSRITNAEKEEFLSNMSKSLKAPLSTVIGLSTTASEEVKDAPAVKEALITIKESGSNILSQIEDALDVTRLNNSDARLDIAQYPAERFCGQMETLFKQECKDKEIKFKLDAKKCPVRIFMVNEARMNQIFINLIKNAMLFTPKGGTISLTMERIAETEDAQMIRFKVSDTGHGISQEAMSEVFVPYKNVAIDDKGTVVNVGASLAIAKRIIELMNGTIKVESRPNGETAFVVDLTMEKAKDDSMKAARNKENQYMALKGKRVLLVDDNAMNVLVTKGIMVKQGIEVECAADGHEALNMFNAAGKGYYDALLTDIMMPRLDGYGLSRAIRDRGDEYGETIPIVSISASVLKEDMEQLSLAGIDVFLHKPVAAQELLDTLLQLIFNKGKLG